MAKVNELHASFLAADGAALTDDELTLLTCCYAYGLASARQISQDDLPISTKRAMRTYVKVGESSAEVLVASLKGLVVSITSEFANKRLGRSWASSMMDDLVNESVCIMLEACSTYDPGRGTSVAQWVATNVREHLKAMKFDRGGGVMPRGWQTVSRAYHTVTTTKEASGELTGMTVVDEVRDRLFQSAKSRGLARGLNDEQAIAFANGSLSKQSINRSLREMSDVLAVTQGVVSLDMADGETGSCLADTLSRETVYVDDGCLDEEAALALVLSVFTSADTDLLTARFGSSGDEVPYRTLAGEAEADWTEVRYRVERTASGVKAAHVQYCAFYPRLSTQFSPAVLEANDARRRLVPVRAVASIS